MNPTIYDIIKVTKYECSGVVGPTRSASLEGLIPMNPQDTSSDIPYGYCHCGCGQKTSIAQNSAPHRGYLRGEPSKYIANHFHAPNRPATEPEARFWKLVDRRGPNQCWEFKGSKGRNGYGQVWSYGKIIRTHRFSWTIHHGPIPDGMFVCHRCDNPSCVNPDHLFLGTHLENMADMTRKGRGRNSGEGRPGENNPCHILTEVDVLAIRNDPELSKLSQVEVGLRFGVSRQTVSDIRSGKRWRYLLEEAGR
jgi:hypothetical protein